MSDDIGRRLEEAGRRSAPGPDPAFADALEVRLLAVARTAAPPPEPPRQPRLVGLRRLLGGVAFAAVVAVLALAVLAGRPVAAPELASRSTSRSRWSTARSWRTRTGCVCPMARW